jgi:gliding motility-associated-like protein
MRLKLLFIILFSTLASSQEAGVWYFGQNAGLKFNPDGTVVALTDGQMNTNEGCATISDPNGNLLFYTNGVTVWNKAHQIMINGTGLLGNPDSTQSAVIVPKPGSSSLFYIFTTDAFANANGLRYSIVDMNLNVGLGGVTDSKNILVYTPTLEKISIVKHSNGIDYWVVTHGNNNIFYSHLLNASGLNTAPVSSVIGIDSSEFLGYSIGYMKISPDGKKLAICHSDILQLLDFNDSNGVVSNVQNIYLGSQLYGVEFSPDSKLVYVTDTASQTKMVQFNLAASNIADSAFILYTGGLSPVALQLAPNGKIYVADFGFDSLGVIDNPNSVGSSCNLQMSAVDLAGKTSLSGLPSFVQSNLSTLSFWASELCFGESAEFTVDADLPIISAQWNFGDGSTSSDINPTHLYGTAGQYNVDLTVTTALGSVTATRQLTISESPTVAGLPLQTVCGTGGENYNVIQNDVAILNGQSSSIFSVQYYLTLSDATQNINSLQSNVQLLSGENIFYVKVSNIHNSNCFNIGTFTVVLYEKPNVPESSPDIILCDDFSNDDQATFNLEDNDSIILNTQNDEFSVKYYLNYDDANAAINQIVGPYQNVTNPQTIYYRISNSNNLSCFEISTFKISLTNMPIANPSQNLSLCDDVNNDGMELFDLSVQTASILGLQSATEFDVSFYLSENEAELGANNISASYTNISNPQTIYVRISNRTGACFDTNSFQLKVNSLPSLEFRESYSLCENSPITLTAPSGFDSYLWSTGLTSPSIQISQPGAYWITGFKDYNGNPCSTTKSFSVVNSSIASDIDIEIQDWTNDQNSITISQNGSGLFEYSLDNIHFQDSNVFYNLSSGQYTIYIRDRNGCGTITKNVFLLMHPKYFTPNGDGINDYWQIKFAETEPNIKILIFDRFGKLIYDLDKSGPGWDGSLNGKQLPSTDYWFMVTRQDGSKHMGHFSLKR